MRQQLTAVWGWLNYTRELLTEAGQRRAQLPAAGLSSMLVLGGTYAIFSIMTGITERGHAGRAPAVG